MKVLQGAEEKEAMHFLDATVQVAKKSTCDDKKCGSIIVKDGIIIGKGFNGVPGNLESQKRCFIDKSSYDKKISDKSCCIHAEERAIMDALRRNPDKIIGSMIYFVWLEDDKMKYSGKPWCTICSKMALDAGIKEFVLWHDTGITVYDTEEYNELSYQYKDD